MTRSTARRLAAILSTAALLSAASTSAASAEPRGEIEHPPEVDVVFGVDLPSVCDFDLRLEATGARWHKVVERGRTTISRGVGYTIVATNVEDPTRTRTFPSTPVVEVKKEFRSGAVRYTTYGSTAILLFEGDRSLDRDQRDGPSAAVHVGGVVVYLDNPDVGEVTGIDVLKKVRVQKTTDLCRALASR